MNINAKNSVLVTREDKKNIRNEKKNENRKKNRKEEALKKNFQRDTLSESESNTKHDDKPRCFGLMKSNNEDGVNKRNQKKLKLKKIGEQCANKKLSLPPAKNKPIVVTTETQCSSNVSFKYQYDSENGIISLKNELLQSKL